MGRAYAQNPQGLKRLWGLWGVGLRLKEQKGPRRASAPPVSEGGGPHLGAQQASQAGVGGANALHPPVLEGPSRLSLLFSPGLPPTSPGPTQPRGGSLRV